MRARGWLFERHGDVYGDEPCLQTEIKRLVRLSLRPWFNCVAPPPLAGRSGAWCGVVIETFFLLRDLGAMRRMVDQIHVLDDDDEAPYTHEPPEGADDDGLALFVEHAGWLTPQAAALRTCLRRIEHACALQVLAESWS